jgi:uncharacterized protein with PIN domain/ribosomal protein S10
MTKVRIRLSGEDPTALDNVVSQIKELSKMLNMSFTGPVRLPRNKMEISCRRTPCGDGTDTYEHWEKRVSKRLCDVEVHKADSEDKGADQRLRQGLAQLMLLLDEMLKRTASWCRVLGMDTQFITGKSDTWLLEHARRNGLIFVTMDVELYNRCVKQGVRCVFLKSGVREEQIAQIIRDTGAAMGFPEKTRCPKCNGELAVVDAAGVRDEVPGNVAETQQKFWKCPSCGKIYWEGSHWKNITRVYERVKELLAQPPG